MEEDNNIPRPLRVLAVDDCPDTRATLLLLLRFWGHEARAVADGPSALEAAAEFLPDVILLDIGLPGLDGFRVARRLRQLPGLGKPLLVALTGLGAAADVGRALAAGCDRHLLKPVQTELLRELLRAEAPCARV